MIAFRNAVLLSVWWLGILAAGFWLRFDAPIWGAFHG